MLGAIKRLLRLLVNFSAPVLDILATPVVWASSHFLRVIRRVGIDRLPHCKKIFYSVGLIPIVDHYYEPFFNPQRLRRPPHEDRQLPAIDLNIEEQLGLLEKFSYNEELMTFPFEKKSDLQFFYNNGAFETGDAEFLYNFIRFIKPAKIIEVGSGYSTMMALQALDKNKAEDVLYNSELLCIEPFENPWLERLDITVLRMGVESIEIDMFKSLHKNDILFIDSSHIIKPQGDLLYIFLEVLPSLYSGVYIHFHDIFTPRDYPWLSSGVTFWNEQYLLEVFLSYNKNFSVIGALNYLRHHHTAALLAKCPAMAQTLRMSEVEPGSFWLRKN